MRIQSLHWSLPGLNLGEKKNEEASETGVQTHFSCLWSVGGRNKECFLLPLWASQITRSSGTATLRVAYHACWRTLSHGGCCTEGARASGIPHRKQKQSSTIWCATNFTRFTHQRNAPLFLIITKTNRWIADCCYGRLIKCLIKIQ
jgi:hypothetical protein